MDLVKTIQDLVEPIVGQYNGYVVDVVIRGVRGLRVVEVFADTDEGITTDVCAEISRQLSAALDAGDVIRGGYRLDVSSPGLDRPLKLHRQYPKNINRVLKIQFTDTDGKKTITGVLRAVTDSSIKLEPAKQEPLEIPMREITRAVVEPQFRRQE